MFKVFCRTPTKIPVKLRITSVTVGAVLLLHLESGILSGTVVRYLLMRRIVRGGSEFWGATARAPPTAHFFNGAQVHRRGPRRAHTPPVGPNIYVTVA
jgi:hypothetical protein